MPKKIASRSKKHLFKVLVDAVFARFVHLLLVGSPCAALSL